METAVESRVGAGRNQWAVRGLALAAIGLVVALVGWSYLSGGILWVLASGWSAEEKLATLRSFFGRFGVAAPLAYLGFVVLEVVVAPIPGTMLYAPGGVIFGGFWGGTLSLLGNVI